MCDFELSFVASIDDTQGGIDVERMSQSYAREMRDCRREDDGESMKSLYSTNPPKQVQGDEIKRY